MSAFDELAESNVQFHKDLQTAINELQAALIFSVLQLRCEEHYTRIFTAFKLKRAKVTKYSLYFCKFNKYYHLI